MKNRIQKSIITVATVALITGLFGCKGVESDAESNKVAIDISGLLQNLPVDSSASSQISSPVGTDAQTTVKTLMVVPLTYSNHGEPYSTDAFDDDTQKDLEDDAVNSANFIQFIQLPTSSDKVQLEVPTASDGWQLLAAATTEKVESADEIENSVIAYIGFTAQAFTSASEFNSANISLQIKRHCDQDAEDRPKGCATFDGDQEAIVTSAVEILKVKITTAQQSVFRTHADPFPWVVRDGATGGDITPATAESQLDAIITSFKSSYSTQPITNITVHVSHQKSSGKPTACTNLTNASSVASFVSSCGEQTYSRSY